VTVKRLFSGMGVYYRGLIVGAVMDDEVMLKADADTAPKFVAAGATQWTYTYPNGKMIKMPYWSIPAEALDDADQLAMWVRLASAAAGRSEKQKSPRRKLK
jgi:DNA transformation protein and related proteins